MKDRHLPDDVFHLQHNTKCCGMFWSVGPKLSASRLQQSIWTSILAYWGGILSNKTSYRIKHQNAISKRQKIEQNGKRIVANSAKGKSMALFFFFFSVATQCPSTPWSIHKSRLSISPPKKNWRVEELRRGVWGLQQPRAPAAEGRFEARNSDSKKNS